MGYNTDSIKTLEFGKAVRTKLGMYLCADLEEALLLGIRELIYNSQDEYEQGYGNQIKISIDTVSRRITVEDNARGIPVGMRDDGVNSLVAAATMPHTGGKHDTEVYSGAVGINGLGLKIVNHTAKELQIKVWRDGKEYVALFESDENGAKLISLTDTKLKAGTKTGTLITYIPDDTIYCGATINIEKLKTTLKELSYFTKGLKFILVVDGKEFIYLSKNGLVDGLEAANRIHKNCISYSETINDVKVELALQWNNKNPNLKAFANNLYMPDGGAFMTGFKTALTKTFNTIADSEYSGETIRKYLDGFVSVKVQIPQFSNQSKTSLANPEGRTACSKAISDALKMFFTKNPKDLEDILKIIQAEKKAEDAAQRARDAINKVVSGGKSINKLRDLPAKLADCNGYGGELFLTEGDSAAGSAKSCRDPRTQAIMALRGKVLNTYGMPLDEMLENEEIKGIVSALGTGIGEKFNIKNLRYDRVIMMADAK